MVAVTEGRTGRGAGACWSVCELICGVAFDGGGCGCVWGGKAVRWGGDGEGDE